MMYMMDFCERHDWQVSPPPPNRVMSGGFFCGGTETKESKRLQARYDQLVSDWRGWSVERRKLELIRFQVHHDQVMETV